MRPHRRLWLVLYLILWLPLQGFALPLMPFCRHGHPQSEAPATAVDGHCQHHAPDQAQGASDAGQHAQSCDGCSLCHLAGASAPVSDRPQLSGDPPPSDLPRYSGHYRSHIPDQPDRPPLAALH